MKLGLKNVKTLVLKNIELNKFMKEKIEQLKEKLNDLGIYKICILSITFSILMSSLFYCWSVLEKQIYFNENQKRTLEEIWKR